MGAHVGQMTGRDELHAMFAAVTTNGATALGLENYGIAEGCFADFVLLQSADPIEAMRLRANRLFVVRRGKVVSESPPRVSHVQLAGERYDIDFRA